MNEEAPTQEAFNVMFIYSDSAVIQARLNARHVIEHRLEEEQYSEFDQGFHLEFFGPGGTVESELTANRGIVNLKNGIAEATGNVVVINREGERMESEKLNWDKARDIIYSDEFVKIHTKNEIIYGDSLEANTDFSSYKIFQVRGVIKNPEGQVE